MRATLIRKVCFFIKKCQGFDRYDFGVRLFLAKTLKNIQNKTKTLINFAFLKIFFSFDL